MHPPPPPQQLALVSALPTQPPDTAVPPEGDVVLTSPTVDTTAAAPMPSAVMPSPSAYPSELPMATGTEPYDNGMCYSFSSALRLDRKLILSYVGLDQPIGSCMRRCFRILPSRSMVSKLSAFLPGITIPSELLPRSGDNIFGALCSPRCSLHLIRHKIISFSVAVLFA
jgi:hypothetical protein